METMTAGTTVMRTDVVRTPPPAPGSWEGVRSAQVGGFFTVYVTLTLPYFPYFHTHMSLNGSSAGKESTCNAGDPRSIPGLGRSPREGIGYPLQYSRASLMAQMVKNPRAVWETWVRSLGYWEDPLEERMATHSSILAWGIPMDKGAWPTVHGVTKSRTQLGD